MTDPRRHGQCLCGGVRVSIPVARNAVGACHCAMCRRWCSGPWMAIQAPEAEIAGETLRIFQASGFAERGFCGTCGSSIFHRPVLGPEIAVGAGLFDAEGLTLTHEIFHDGKPAFYRFEGDTRKRSALSMALEWGPRLLWRRIRHAGGRAGAGKAGG